MFKKITKIKDFGIYRDFKWNTETPELKKFNVIYGWNGSGKTSLTRILRAFEIKKLHDDFKHGEFEIELNDGNKRSQQDLEKVPNVKVFNTDFIEENIHWKETKSNTVLYVGKKSAEFANLLAEKNKQKDQLNKLVGDLELKQKKDKSQLDSFCRAEASQIKTTLTTSNRRDKYANYDKRGFEESIRKHIQKPFNTLNVDEITDKNKIIQGSSLPKVLPFTLSVPEFNKINTKLNELGETTVVAKVIEALKSDLSVSKWVQDGLALHKNRQSEECLFCSSPLSSSRLSDLEGHFSEQLSNFQNTCTQYLELLEQRKVPTSFPKLEAFYPDYHQGLKKLLDEVSPVIDEVNKYLDDQKLFVEAKKNKPFESYMPVVKDLSDQEQRLREVGLKISEIIGAHNAASDNFEKRIQDTKEELEGHYISIQAETYNSLAELYSSSLQAYEKNDSDIKKLNSEIQEIKNTMSSAGLAVDKFNNLLQKFLGRSDIKIELREDQSFTFKRDGKPAKNLSEGEKTAIAFVYFVIKLGEQDFDIRNGCVVIDDPISSLDSNALHAAFGFVKGASTDAGQIIILTHNFYFLKRVGEWFKYVDKKKQCFLMISTKAGASGREAVIQEMDVLLRKYHSEYHYLFKVMHDFSTQDVADLEKFYGIPNISRKFLETWLGFRDLRPVELGNKMEKLTYDSVIKNKITSFVNANSHSGMQGAESFDPTLLQETPVIIKAIFDMIKDLDPIHYASLENLVNDTTLETT